MYICKSIQLYIFSHKKNRITIFFMIKRVALVPLIIRAYESDW